MSAPETAPAEPAIVRHRYLVLLLLAALLYLPWLGNHDLWYPDEPDIAEVARAMYVSGDWVAPRALGEIWIDYPPMIYWAGCVSSHLLGGMTAFTLRLPSALAGIALVLLAAAAGSRWFGGRAGLFAGLVLLASPQLGWQAVGYRPDVIFGLLVSLGLVLYALGAGARPRWWLRVAGFAVLGAAILAKGPLGLLLPGLVLTLWHGFRKEWGRLLALAPLALVSLAVAAPWHWLCGEVMGQRAFWDWQYAQNFGRFGSGDLGHGRPPWYYLVGIWADLAPFVLLLPWALGRLFRERRTRDPHVLLSLCWFGAFFVFLSLAATKRHLYLIPAYPAVALLLGTWLADVGREGGPAPRPARVVAGITCWVLLIGGALVAAGTAVVGPILDGREMDVSIRRVVLDARLPAAVTGAISVALGYGAWRARRELPKMLVRTAVACIVVFAAALALVVPCANPTKTYVPQAEWIRARIGDSTAIGLVNVKGGTKKAGALAFYLRLPVRMPDMEDEAIRGFFDENPESLLLVEERASDAFFRKAGDHWRDQVTGTIEAARQVYLVLQRR